MLYLHQPVELDLWKEGGAEVHHLPWVWLWRALRSAHSRPWKTTCLSTAVVCLSHSLNAYPLEREEVICSQAVLGYKPKHSSMKWGGRWLQRTPLASTKMGIVTYHLSSPGKPTQWSLTASLVGPWLKAQTEPWPLFSLVPHRKEVSESRLILCLWGVLCSWN